MAPEASDADIAEAMGFASVQKMQDHQEWLAQQAEHARRVQAAVRKMRAEGSNVLDMRGVFA